MGRAVGWGNAFARKDLLGPVSKAAAPCAPRQRVKAAASCPPCAAEYLPLGRVEVDPRRFQNREAEFSEASVERITSGYDPNLLDPVVVWKDPKTGQVLVLSGHSRYEAHRRLGKARLPVRFFQGSEAEARDYARGFANRAATPETLVEDLKVLREFKAKAAPQKALKQAFGPRLRRLEDLSYLAPTGRFLALLAQDETVQRQLPYAELKASWVGELRKKYPQLTARHEDELFEYFLTTPKTIVPKKEELFDLVARRVGRADFGPSAALGLRVASTGTEARADTGPSQRRIYEIDREMTMLEQQRRLAQTAEEKRVLRDQLAALEHERGYLTRGIETALRTQSALFGPRVGMPSFLLDGHQFDFVSADCGEPAHLHGGPKGKGVGKFWLVPFGGRTSAPSLADRGNLTAAGVRSSLRVLVRHQGALLTAWEQHCKGYTTPKPVRKLRPATLKKKRL